MSPYRELQPRERESDGLVTVEPELDLEPNLAMGELASMASIHA